MSSKMFRNVDLHLSRSKVSPFLTCVSAIVTLDGETFQLPLPCHAFIILALIKMFETWTPLCQSYPHVTTCCSLNFF